jgi:hypothetical protein
MEAVVAYFELVSQRLPGGAEKSHENFRITSHGIQLLVCLPSKINTLLSRDGLT